MRRSFIVDKRIDTYSELIPFKEATEQQLKLCDRVITNKHYQIIKEISVAELRQMDKDLFSGGVGKIQAELMLAFRDAGRNKNGKNMIYHLMMLNQL